MSNDEKTLAERAAEGARRREDGQRTDNAAADAAHQQDLATHRAWLARACTPPSRGWLGFLGRKQADVDGELRWLGALPFRVEWYESIFNDSIAVDRWAIRLQFAGKTPEQTLVENLFASLPTKFRVGTVRVASDRRDFYAEHDMSAELRRSATRLWQLRLQFHEVVDQVLVPLHQEYPLAVIECRDSHHFDMSR